MLSRRDRILSGALASSVRPGEARAAQRTPPAAGDPTAQDFHEIRDALRDLRHMTVSSEVSQIREKQRAYFKLNQEFPDYIDIGIQVWERLQDWHIENQQALKVSRTGAGRVEMEFMLTTLVLRPDLPDSQIGAPYDR
jgi:hypothetical protein